jgi:type I restriction enzyme S subunit
MIEGWEIIAFTDCLINNNVGRANQINASEIKKEGRYPVVDQGQDFIAGYSDEEDKLVKDGLPYVIFGDHTRCFKFVDFPFIVGADGTKVLSPNKDLFDPKFFFYQLLSLEIPSRGYNRHFKLLKEKHLQKPPLPEQRKIAYVLSTVQKAIEQQDKLIRTTTELKKALMQKLFTEGTKGEKLKQTEIGWVPESWEVTTIGRIADVTSGGTPSRKEISFWENGNIPWVKTGEVDYCVINEAEEYITDLGLKNTSAKLYPKGTLLMAMYGQGITRGKVAILGIDAAINQACAAIVPLKNANVLTEYLYYYFEQKYDFVRSLSHGANQKNLSGNIIKSIEVSFPKDLTIQRFIISTLKFFDNKKFLLEKKKQTLTNLFKTLLHELMTGQRRVHEIDFENECHKVRNKKEEMLLAAEPNIKYKK